MSLLHAEIMMCPDYACQVFPKNTELGSDRLQTHSPAAVCTVTMTLYQISMTIEIVQHSH